MDLSDYRILVTGNDAEAASRVIGVLSARGMKVEKISRLPRIKSIPAAGETVILVIISGGVHEQSTLRFLEGIKHAPASMGVICLVEPTEPEKLNYFDSLGVDEVFEKPVDGEEIAQAASRLLERNRLIDSIKIIGKTPPMREAVERVAQYSQVNSTVLIFGESGTGKELVAQAIHRLSARRHKPFIAVNCAAIAEGVLESELFGHEKGSFTGASSLRKGHFEIAGEGTIFLDEVGEMPLSVQAKLLRVLEERELMRVGGSTKIRVNVRMLAATNKNLDYEVERGNFRRDLFYRLKVLSIQVPSLRERREDIPLLMNYFIEQFCQENNKTFAGIDQQALEILKNYDWPGNVRELRNLAESMVVLSLGSRIRARDIPDQILRRGSPERLLPVHYAGIERREGEAAEMIDPQVLYRVLVNLQKELGDIKQLLTGGTGDFIRQPPYAADSETGESVFTGPDTAENPQPEGDISEYSSVQFEDTDDTVKRGQSMKDVEQNAIARVLAGTGGNRRKTAKILGIGERTLYRKIKEYGLK